MKISQLLEAGEESRAETQRVKLQRYLDLQETETALTKQRVEGEGGLVCAQCQCEGLEYKAFDPKT
eukprot:6341914-Pyramimonas_sp.AAC.1